MATVLCGVSTDDQGRQDAYALKMIREAYAMNQEFVAMFAEEARTVASFNHPNIVQVHELGWEGNRLFMAMELLRGPSLWATWNACRERGVRMRYELIAYIGAQIAEGLHYAHTHTDAQGRPSQIVHRDVNPSNILLTYDGRVKVIDFGLAKAVNRVSQSSRMGVVKGKLAYMSPEQATPSSGIDFRTDIFALGITLWEISTDRRLFKADTEAQTLEQVLRLEVPDPALLVEDYPPALRNIVMRALERDPQRRYRSASDMAQDLRYYVQSAGADTGAGFLRGVLSSLFPEDEARLEAWIRRASTSPSLNSVTLRPGPAASVRMAMPSIPPAAESDASLMAEGNFAPPSRALSSKPLLVDLEASPHSALPNTQIFADAKRRSNRWVFVALIIVAACVVALGFGAGRQWQ